MTQQAELDRFCTRVRGDRELQDALAASTATEVFVALAVETGRRAGFGFDATTVETRLRDARGAMLLRGLDD